MTPIKPDTFTEKQQRFVEEYPRDCNASAAARRAGYSPDSAADIGYELKQNPAIMAAIDERLKALAMSADEAIKHIDDIARTRLNSYLKVVERERPTQVRQPLAEAIAELKRVVAFEEKVHERLHLFSPEDGTHHFLRQLKRKNDIIRLEVELEDNPAATRLIAGDPERYEAIEVDLVALAKADTEGRIKTLSFTEHGPKVELYAADAALRDILRMNGLYNDKVDVTTNGDSLNATNDARNALLSKLTEGQE